ncbi:MAG: hypothetical protein V3T00_04250 [bacterium]
MYASTSLVTTSAESSAQLPHSNVLAHRRTPEQPKPELSGAQAGVGAEDTSSSPSTYMLLISRVENMIRRNALEQATVDELREHLARNLGTVPESTRQTVRNLREYVSLGVENIAQLADSVIRNLREPGRAQAALALLKQPTFVAIMRNEQRMSLYGPRGVLRAS